MQKLVPIILSSLIFAPILGVEPISVDNPVVHHAPLLPWTDDLNQAQPTAKAESFSLLYRILVVHLVQKNGS